MQLRSLITQLETIEKNSYLYEGLNTEQKTSVKLWESAGLKLKEAQLTADQIQQIFQAVEQGATAGGDNRTLLGKGKDAASAVNKAWEDLKTKVQNSGPMKNVDAAYDSAVAKIEAGLGGPDNAINKVIQRYRKFAKDHPIAQSLIYAALIAAAGISGAGLGGAATLGLLKMTDKLLQGEKFTSAAYQGAKTGALAYGASKLGDYIKGKMAGDQPAAGSSGSAADAASGNLPYKGPFSISREAERIFREKVANGEVTDYNSYQQGMQDSLDQALAKFGDAKISMQSQDTARQILRAKLDAVVADANGGQFSGSGPQKVKELIKVLGGQPDEASLGRAQAAVDQLSQPPNPATLNAPGSDDWVNAGKNLNKAATSAASNVDVSQYPTTGDAMGGAKEIGKALDPSIAPTGPDGTPMKMVPMDEPTGQIGKALDPSIAPTGPDGTPMKMVPMDEPASTAASSVPTGEVPKGAAMDPEYLKKAASGDGGRYLVGKDEAKAALDWQTQNGGPYIDPRQAAADAAEKAAGSQGFSKDYLEKAADPNRTGRYLISPEKAQELLGQINGPSVSFTDGNAGTLTLPSGESVPAYAFPPDGIQPRIPPGAEKITVNIGGQKVEGSIWNGKAYFKGFDPSSAGKLKESEIQWLFARIEDTIITEGVLDAIKGAAGKAASWAATKGHNLTTKITADKLNSAWKAAGSPTDSEEVKKVIVDAGVDPQIIDKAMSDAGAQTTATEPKKDDAAADSAGGEMKAAEIVQGLDAAWSKATANQGSQTSSPAVQNQIRTMAKQAAMTGQVFENKYQSKNTVGFYSKFLGKHI